MGKAGALIDFFKRHGHLALGGIFLLVLAIQYAVPVWDGDFFWQLEYGRYLWENKTLTLDHTLYSWTPTDGSAIYCAWIGELLLFGLYSLGGLPLLFGLRYALFLFVTYVLWTFARLQQQDKSPHTYLIFLVVLLSSYSAVFLKPELFSMLFMTTVPAIFFSVKCNLKSSKVFFLFPLIFLLWVNTHGVFEFGLVILAVIAIGEIFNRLFCRTGALKGENSLRDLIVSTVLSFAVTIFNPYGIRYHAKLLSALFPSGAKQVNLQVITAYHNIFGTIGTNQAHYFWAWIIMVSSFVVILGVVIWKRKQWDWGIFFVNCLLCFLSAKFLRATYYWGPTWGLSILFLISKLRLYKPETRTQNFFQLLACIIFIIFAAQTLFVAWTNTNSKIWVGFGIGYQNPVQESFFLKQHNPGTLLFNTYETGGYLIHDLYPQYKVFIDQRYFPYISWIDDFFDFKKGATNISSFNKKYPFDVALIGNQHEAILWSVLMSPEWKPVFYGTAATVFIKKEVPFDHDFLKEDVGRFNDLWNLGQTYKVFKISLELLDDKAATHLLQLAKDRFKSHPLYTLTVSQMELMYNGMNAMSTGNKEFAFANMNNEINAISKDNKEFALANMDNEINALSKDNKEFAFANLNKVRSRLPLRGVLGLFHLRSWKSKMLAFKGDYDEALALLEKNLVIYPQNPKALYNAGILGLYINKTRPQPPKALDNAGILGLDINQQYLKSSANMFPQKSFGSMVDGSHNRDRKWRSHLEKFLEVAPEHPQATNVRKLLENKGFSKKLKYL